MKGSTCIFNGFPHLFSSEVMNLMALSHKCSRLGSFFSANLVTQNMGPMFFPNFSGWKNEKCMEPKIMGFPRFERSCDINIFFFNLEHSCQPPGASLPRLKKVASLKLTTAPFILGPCLLWAFFGRLLKLHLAKNLPRHDGKGWIDMSRCHQEHESKSIALFLWRLHWAYLHRQLRPTGPSAPLGQKNGY